MNRSLLIASSALALALYIGPASAQGQQQGRDEKGPASQMQNEPTPGKGSEKQSQQKEQTPQKGSTAEQKGEGEKGGTAKQAQPQDKKANKAAQGQGEGKSSKDGQKSSQTEKKGQSKDSAQSGTEGKSGKEAQKSSQEKSATPPDTSKQGTAQGETKDKGQATAPNTSERPKDSAASKSPSGTDQKADSSRSGGRIQLSEQQRTNVHQTLIKEGKVNRVTNVNFSIRVGTRVPREVRLEVLPASVIAIVPEYRSYRYFLVNDEICIVEPSSYEIVEVITVSGGARAANSSGPATLVLTEEERMILLREIDMRDGSTLALGALSEGADVPREVKVQTFTETIVQKVPKVKGYRFFTAENRLAIVDPQGTKVQLVIEGRR